MKSVKSDLDIKNTTMLPESVEEISSLTNFEPAIEKQSLEGNKNYIINDEQQMLVGLVCDELTGMSHELIDVNAVKDIKKRKVSLIIAAEQVENISNAVDLIGLEGLGNACRYISSNIHTLALNECVLSDENIKMLTTWPNVIRVYLQNIASKSASDQLLAFVTDVFWPESIDLEAINELERLLKQPEFQEEEKKSRQLTADVDDMSLGLPEDVNAELLEALLQDLPVQTEQFSAAIQNIQFQKELKYLEIAQRIAHTIKGAGNVVGVKGVINLTHQLEDILEIHSKANKLPTHNLIILLVDAADCLEAMCEALLGFNEVPDNSLVLFQSVLDWANLLDEKGATDISLDLFESSPALNFTINSQTKPEHLKISKDVNKQPINVENMIRVPVELLDDLLRLAGENLISTSQIQESIKTIQYKHRMLINHNNVLQQLSFDLEKLVDIQGASGYLNIQSSTDKSNNLELKLFNELHSMNSRLAEISADSIEISKVLDNDFTHLHGLVVTQSQLQKENEILVLKTKMVSTKTIIARLKRGVKQVCRLTEKHVDLEVVDNDTYMDSEVLNELIEPLMHILRNAIDHGIETKEVREIVEKDFRGHITLAFDRKGEQIEISIKDDGKGLNLANIKEKAFSLGLVKNKSDVTAYNLQNFIVQPGFTTRSGVSQVSGRGIGLDVVNSKIRELKGSIDISSVEGQGCCFLITLPISSFSVRSLLVRVRQNIVAISSRGIEEIYYSGLEEVQKNDNKIRYKLGEHVYDAHLIEDLLDLPVDRREVVRASRPVILVKGDTGNIFTVIVQEIIENREVVIKSTGLYGPKIPGIIGATVLGDGSIATVIDLPELKQSAHEMFDNKNNNSGIEVKSIKAKPLYVLVVDDSLSARKSLTQFMEDLNFEVRIACDGVEAISLMNKRKPDLMLVDMEMPKMNGLELTAYARGSENMRDVPIIMITSRSTDKHRKLAIDKGINHFLVKPFDEDKLSFFINKALKIT